MARHRAEGCRCTASFTCRQCFAFHGPTLGDTPVQIVTYKGRRARVRADTQRAAQHIASHRERHGYRLEPI